jgi:hypothetical protein
LHSGRPDEFRRADYQNIVTATHAELEMECNVIGAARAAEPVVHRTASRID